jgi:hypothetical protein
MFQRSYRPCSKRTRVEGRNSLLLFAAHNPKTRRDACWHRRMVGTAAVSVDNLTGWVGRERSKDVSMHVFPAAGAKEPMT